MADQEAPKLEFSLQGDPRDDGLVLAKDFVQFISSVLDTLNRLEMERGRKLAISYRIVELEIGSAVVALEAYSDVDAVAPEVFGDFLQGIAAIRDGTIARQKFRPETKKAFSSLMRPIGANHLRSVTVRSDSVAIELAGTSELPLRVAMSPQVVSVGTMTGYIDAVNVHKEPVFFLYPTAGPARVRCQFDRTMLDKVKGALKQFVAVRGLQEYPESSPFPVRIIVDDIDVYLESEIPSLASLWGSVPDLTGELDSVSYVRVQRDAEE